MSTTARSLFFSFVIGIFITLSLASVKASSNELGSPFIRNFTSKEYNANPQNWTIVQDGRGIMYFANTDGILEFDGNDWRFIETAKKSWVRSIATDDNGIIYAGGGNEIGFLSYDEKGTTIYISLVDKLRKEDSQFLDVWSINNSTHGVYFVTNYKLFRWKNDKFDVIPLATQTRKKGFTVYDKIFIYDFGGGISVLHNSKLLSLPHCRKFSKETAGYVSVLPYFDNRLLIVTEKQGCFIYDLKLLSFVESSKEVESFGNISESILERLPSEADDYFRHNIFYTGIPIDDYRYALGTCKGGIVIIDKNGKLIQIINEKRGLHNNDVSSLFLDRQNNLWAGLSIGISHIEISSPLTLFDDSSGIKSAVYSITRHKEKIYIGTYTHGVLLLEKYHIRLDEDSHSFVQIPNYKGKTVWDFLSLDDYLLSFSDEVYYTVGQTSKRIEGTGQAFCLGRSKTLPNHIFVGLSVISDGGLAYIEVKRPNTTRNINESNKNSIDEMNSRTTFEYKGKIKGIRDVIRKISADKNGDLWLSTYLNRLIHIRFKDFKDDDLSTIKIERYTAGDGLPENRHNRAHWLDGQLIVTTNKGIYKGVQTSDSESGESRMRFVPENTFGKMFRDRSLKIEEIQKYKRNKLLIHSVRKVGILTRGQNGLYEFNTRPFNRIDTVINKVFIDNGDVIWIGTDEGVFRYNPLNDKDYEHRYHTLIRRVTVGKNVIYDGAFYNILEDGKGHDKANRKIAGLVQPKGMIKTLEYEDNSIIFEYSAPSYEGDYSNRFKYMLEGFDDTWNDWSLETKKEYTNLPEGNYRFRVKAKDIYEKESEEAVYEIRILPPWHRTIRAYLSYLVLFLLTFYIGIRIYTKRLIAARDKQIENERKDAEQFVQMLEIKVEDRTRELKDVNQKLGDANESLRDLDKMKNRFFANISHELRTPLTLILAPVESILGGELGEIGEEPLEQISGVRRSALELLKHIDDLLDLSRLEEARLRLKIEEFDISSLIVRIIDFARPLAERKQIEIDLESKEEIVAKADEAKLERVFVNLLSNALKFTDSCGKILIRVYEDNKMTNVAIEDNGIGIAKEDMEHIFDRFGQVDETMTRRRGGSGIGLSLAKEIVELHCGQLTVTSELNQGSTFLVEIPKRLEEMIPENLLERRVEQKRPSPERREQDKPKDQDTTEWTDEILSSPEYRFMGIDRVVERRVAPRQQPVDFKSARLLIADDNTEVLSYLQQSLKDRYDIWTAQDGKEAWELLLTHRHDLVVADVMMPIMSGLELTHRIKGDSRTQDTPVILLTARSHAEHRVEGHAVGADQYVTKPFNLSELRAAIKSLILSRTRRIEHGARRRSASMETLLGGMAHELHNACHQLQNAQTAISTMAMKLATQPQKETNPKVAGNLTQMESICRRALERISKVVQSLQHYTRNQMQMPWKIIKLDNLIKREMPLLAKAEEKGAEIKLLLDPNSAIQGPEEEIRQMVINVVENAIYAVEKGGLVEVKTTSIPGKVQLSVSDNGCGIPADKKDHVFDPFFTTKDPGEGMGLGLSLCRRTVTDLGGDIELRSEESVGTQILIELPAASFGSTKPPPAI